MANYRDEAVYITGGWTDREVLIETILKFDFTTSKWTEGPGLN